MFAHNVDGPKLLQSHAVNATQHIWNWVTNGPSKLCMVCLNSGDSSLCRYGMAFCGTTVATWSDAATLRGCFVNWWRGPASPLKSLKRATASGVGGHCQEHRAHVIVHEPVDTCGLLASSRFAKKLHRTACDSPRNEVFWWLHSGIVVACRLGILVADLSGPLVRLQGRKQDLFNHFSCHRVKQHGIVRPCFGGEQVTPNMSTHKLKLTFHNWSRTQRYTDGRNVAMSLKFC